MSSDFRDLERVLAQSRAAQAVQACSGAVRTAWAHSAASRQVTTGLAALGALTAAGRLRFWSMTIVWMGIGMMVSGMLLPSYSAPVWPVGQGLALAIGGASLAAGAGPLAAAWFQSRLRRWLLVGDPDQTNDA